MEKSGVSRFLGEYQWVGDRAVKQKQSRDLHAQVTSLSPQSNLLGPDRLCRLCKQHEYSISTSLVQAIIV